MYLQGHHLLIDVHLYKFFTCLDINKIRLKHLQGQHICMVEVFILRWIDSQSVFASNTHGASRNIQ